MSVQTWPSVTQMTSIKVIVLQSGKRHGHKKALSWILYCDVFNISVFGANNDNRLAYVPKALRMSYRHTQQHTLTTLTVDILTVAYPFATDILTVAYPFATDLLTVDILSVDILTVAYPFAMLRNVRALLSILNDMSSKQHWIYTRNSWTR
jgi:hypothetical protein